MVHCFKVIEATLECEAPGAYVQARARSAGDVSVACKEVREGGSAGSPNNGGPRESVLTAALGEATLSPQEYSR